MVDPNPFGAAFQSGVATDNQRFGEWAQLLRDIRQQDQTKRNLDDSQEHQTELAKLGYRVQGDADKFRFLTNLISMSGGKDVNRPVYDAWIGSANQNIDQSGYYDALPIPQLIPPPANVQPVNNVVPGYPPLNSSVLGALGWTLPPAPQFNFGNLNPFRNTP